MLLSKDCPEQDYVRNKNLERSVRLSKSEQPAYITRLKTDKRLLRTRQNLSLDRPRIVSVKPISKVLIKENSKRNLFKKPEEITLVKVAPAETLTDPNDLDLLIEEVEEVAEEVQTVIVETAKQKCFSKKKKYAVAGVLLLTGYLIGKNS